MLQRKLFVAFSLQPLDEEMNEHKKLQVIEESPVCSVAAMTCLSMLPFAQPS